MTDWSALHRALWQAVRAYGARLGETAAEYAEAIVAAVRRAGLALSPEAAQALNQYVLVADTALRAGIAAALTPVAGALGAGLRADFIAQATAEAYARRWPDGLRLSDRVWQWEEATRRGVSEALANAVQVGRATDGAVYDLQRAIEAAGGQRFRLEQTYVEDWAVRLTRAGRYGVREPRGMTLWAQAVAEAREHVDSLRDGGTRRQARVALERITAAINAGRQELTAQHLTWWLYDRQLYALKRIVRTEMATAHHRAVIATTEGDADVVGYRWRLSASHPEPDICDYYADVDFGMGAGVWPKDRVPRSKAHPHCMCLLIPTTRRMRKDGKRGSTDVAQFMERLPEATRERLVPRWAQDLRALGMPLEALQRPDGQWLMGKAEAMAQLGEERFAAAKAIGNALREPQWRANRVSLAGRMWSETERDLAGAAGIREVDDLIADARAAGGREVDSRRLHYIKRRYIDGWDLRGPEDLDRAFADTVNASDTLVYRLPGKNSRYHLYSARLNRLAVIDPSGRRVSIHTPREGVIEKLGDHKWARAALID